ncbi:family 43 glycosylhydrolase [Isoptericola jiangsuensis]|uniref:family 43 glycosylhydrolase n=1 Tax=Isoptericola jiangsuensis TaxID=548579 RepID=UPI003AACA2FE
MNASPPPAHPWTRTWLAGLAATLLVAVGLVALPQSTAQAAAPTPGQWYVIQSAHSGLALDIKDISTTAGAPLQQWERWDGQGQQFRFLDSGGGYYRIQARHSSMVLDVYGWNAENGAEIVQWQDLNAHNQQWRIRENSDGTVAFLNRFSGKALDLYDFATEGGARISQYTDNGAAVQKWRLVKPGELTNPIRTNGADPWIQYSDGYYYMSTTTWDSTVTMRRSTTLAGLSAAPDQVVWDDAGSSSRCCSHWAPEFHRIDGTWYLTYTSGNSQTNFDGQKIHVLRSTSSTPMGPYEFMGTPMPNRWNIDSSYLEHNGSLYMLFSEWIGADQTVRIVKMTNPWTTTGSPATISTPTHSWETQGGRTNEGAAVIKHGGRTFVSFSASSCNTPDYKIGMLELTGSNPLNPSHWTKQSQPAMQKGNGVFGPGHNGFFKSPDGTEDWIVYHGNTTSTQGCGATRQTRVQKVTWSSAGLPVLGAPVPAGQVMTPPSGE